MEYVDAISLPAKAGMLEIQHTKVITESTYTRAQLKTVKEIKNVNIIYKTSDEYEGVHS